MTAAIRMGESVSASQNLRRRAVRAVGMFLLRLLWVASGLLFIATALELGFRVREAMSPHVAHESRTAELDDAYDPFTVQYVNPHYLFFFPFSPDDRIALSNKVVTLDADGFRGAGPAHAGARRLAFLLGGSTAFGHYASSDLTTITGYLNRLQTAYHFVNAGVPSWNSTQELFRTAFQLLDHQPALIVTLDGANDAALLEEYEERYPFGTPESFDALAS